MLTKQLRLENIVLSYVSVIETCQCKTNQYAPDEISSYNSKYETIQDSASEYITFNSQRIQDKWNIGCFCRINTVVQFCIFSKCLQKKRCRKSHGSNDVIASHIRSLLM
jgi:hypothetical protein